MISNHYAMTYQNRNAWLVLGFIMAAGVFIRHFFNLRHKGRIEWRYPAIGVALLLAVAVVIAPSRPVSGARPAGAGGVDSAAQFAQVKSIIGQRCVACHSATPTQPGFATAPAGVMLDTADQIVQRAAQIQKQVVELKAMPIANLTNMTDAERAQVAAWLAAGAKQ